MQFWCERAECYNVAVLRCSKCEHDAISHSFGQFCSRDCQMASYNPHSYVHKVTSTLRKGNSSKGKLLESMALAIRDAANQRLLPALKSDGVLSILCIGCKDFVEGNLDYFQLYEHLVALQVCGTSVAFILEVTLLGPELTSKVPYHHPSGRVTVNFLGGRLQRLFPPDATYNPLAVAYSNVGAYSHTVHKINVSQYMSFNTYDGHPAYAPASALSTHYACAFLRNPDLGGGWRPPSPPRSPSGKGSTAKVRNSSTNANKPKNNRPSSSGGTDPTLQEQWEPAVQVLLQAGLLTFVVTCCAEERRHAKLAQSLLPSLVTTATTTATSSSSNGSSSSQHASPPTGKGSPSRGFGAPVFMPVEAVHTVQDTHPDHQPPVTQDEMVLDKHYRARIVVPHTCLPCSSCNSEGGPCPAPSPAQPGSTLCNSGGGGSARQDSYPTTCMYVAFSGRREPFVDQQIHFYQYMAAHNAALRDAALQFVSELGTGRKHLSAHATQTDLEQEAIRRNMIIHPLRAQLLQHELLAQMRSASPAQSREGAGTGTAAPATPNSSARSEHKHQSHQALPLAHQHQHQHQLLTASTLGGVQCQPHSADKRVHFAGITGAGSDDSGGSRRASGADKSDQFEHPNSDRRQATSGASPHISSNSAPILVFKRK